MIIKRLIAFTMAEILIVLGIIGVIATITIPTLINNVQKHQYVAALKENYSDINQALLLMMSGEGVSEFRDLNIFDDNYMEDSGKNDKIDSLVKKYFKVIKSCKYGDNSCKINGYRYLNGGIPFSDFFNSYVFYKPDGAVISLDISPSCSSSNKFGDNGCGVIEIDINGLKPPNIKGRDLFSFYIMDNAKLYPTAGIKMCEAGGDCWYSDSSFCGEANNPDASASDGDCSARIIENGWVMDY